MLLLLNSLSEKEEEAINQEYLEICRSRMPTREELTIRFKEYKNRIGGLLKEKECLKIEIKTLNKEIKKLEEKNLFLQNQIEESNKFLSDFIQEQSKKILWYQIYQNLTMIK